MLCMHASTRMVFAANRVKGRGELSGKDGDDSRKL